MKTNQKVTTAVRACLLAAFALLLTGPVPAQAAAAPDSSRADYLYVTVTRGETPSYDVRGSLLLCDPVQGPGHAERACGELRAVHGEVALLPVTESQCPLIYAPVSAAAHGEWDGRTITYEETFANACVLAARTGAVFAMDE